MGVWRSQVAVTRPQIRGQVAVGRSGPWLPALRPLPSFLRSVHCALRPTHDKRRARPKPGSSLSVGAARGAGVPLSWVGGMGVVHPLCPALGREPPPCCSSRSRERGELILGRTGHRHYDTVSEIRPRTPDARSKRRCLRQSTDVELGRVGIWSSELRAHADTALVAETAADLEELGYSALFVPGRAGGDVLERCELLLRATNRAAVAPGILNVWMHDPADVARERARLEGEHPGRFWLGLGISHAPLIDRKEPGLYRKPLSKMREYLDQLDAAEPPVPPDARFLAALGPKMLELARDRSSGAHPYFVPV